MRILFFKRGKRAILSLAFPALINTGLEAPGTFSTFTSRASMAGQVENSKTTGPSILTFLPSAIPADVSIPGRRKLRSRVTPIITQVTTPITRSIMKAPSDLMAMRKILFMFVSRVNCESYLSWFEKFCMRNNYNTVPERIGETLANGYRENTGRCQGCKTTPGIASPFCADHSRHHGPGE